MEPNQIEKPRMSPKDFFLHFATMVTLYVSATSLLILLFQIINLSFKDALDTTYYFYYDPYNGSIRFAIASLLVIFPVFLVLARLLNKSYEIEPAKRNLGVRKWFTYFTLFAAGAILVGDLITLVNTFLGGEITVRFILKVLAVFVVIGLIFFYHLRDIRREGVLSLNERRMFRYGVILLVIASIVSGFFIMGTPQSQRAKRFDNERVSDLETIQWQVVEYWQQKEKLPQALSETEDSIRGYVIPFDPETGESYEYAVTGQRSFTLCANFSLKSDSDQSESRVYRTMGEGNDNWEHEKGRHCFERTIDPELYPPYPKPYPGDTLRPINIAI